MRLRGVVLALVLLFSGGAAFAEQSAQDFLNAIYAAYRGKDSKGVSLSERGAVARYFTPALARMIDADARAAAKRGDVPNLAGDPFIDAQDWEIESFAIDVKERGKDKATATVKFKNAGENVTMTLDLVKLKDGWRIDEIRGPSGSLRALFKKR